MKFISWILGIIIILLVIGIIVDRKETASNSNVNGSGANATSTASNATSTTPTSTLLPTITPITHATAIIQWGTTTIYTDPTGDAAAFSSKPAPNIVIITDIHGDHLSTSTLAALLKPTSSSSTTPPVLIVPKAVKDLLPSTLISQARALTTLANGSSTIVAPHGITVTAIPMYNLPESKDSRHIKGRGNGYVLEKDGVRVYVAGDTSGIPEMRALRDIDIALVPMNPPYTMSVDEAADAVLEFVPRHVYPYHYRGQDGLNDIAKFKTLVNTGNPGIDVVLLNWYPK